MAFTALFILMQESQRFRMPSSRYAAQSFNIYDGQFVSQDTKIPNSQHNIKLFTNKRTTYMDSIIKSATGKYNMLDDPYFLATQYFYAYQKQYKAKKELYDKISSLRSKSINTQRDNTKKYIIEQLSLIYDDNMPKNIFRPQNVVQETKLLLKSDPSVKYKHKYIKYYIDGIIEICSKNQSTFQYGSALSERIKLIHSQKNHEKKQISPPQLINNVKSNPKFNKQQISYAKTSTNQLQIKDYVNKRVNQLIKKSVVPQNRSKSTQPKHTILNEQDDLKITQNNFQNINNQQQNQQIIKEDIDHDVNVVVQEKDTTDPSLSMNLYLSSPIADTADHQDVDKEPLFEQNGENTTETAKQQTDISLRTINSYGMDQYVQQNNVQLQKVNKLEDFNIQSKLDAKIQQLQKKFGLSQMNKTLYNTAQFDSEQNNRQQNFDQRYQKIKQSIMEINNFNSYDLGENDIVQKMQRKLEQFENNYNVIHSQISNSLTLNVQ